MSTTEIQSFKCHKVVNAAKIVEFIKCDDGSTLVTYYLPGVEKKQSLIPSSGFKERFKGTDADMGYYVKYNDGYDSWSPSHAFEEGYHSIPTREEAMAKIDEFKKAAEPLLELLYKYYDPHVKVVVSQTHLEVSRLDMGIPLPYRGDDDAPSTK